MHAQFTPDFPAPEIRTKLIILITCAGLALLNPYALLHFIKAQHLAGMGAVVSYTIATALTVSVLIRISATLGAQYRPALQPNPVIDPLTGLLNRALLRDTLQAAVEQAHRQQTPMTLLLLDLDNLKAIVDTDGRDAGDQVLLSISEIIQQLTRVSDCCFRLGREEVMCVLIGANYTSASLVAGRIRAKIDTTTLTTSVPATTSMGVCTLQPGESWQHWLARADEKLYNAQQAGKNCIA